MNLFGYKGKYLIGTVLGCAALLHAGGDIRQLDIVIRDFQPSHPDFENFSEEFSGKYDGYAKDDLSALKERKGQPKKNYMVPGVNQGYFGYDDNWYTAKAPYHTTCGNKASKAGAMIGQDGFPKTQNLYLPAYLRTTSSLPELKYGECGASTVPGITQRGYEQVVGDVKGFVCQGKNDKGDAVNWSNEVYYTPGMVQTYLEFHPTAEGEYDMYDSVRILKANELCDNQFFHQWYTDAVDESGARVNLRTNTTMDIPQDGDSKYFVYDYNFNNGGYSPLDSIDPITKQWVSQKPCNASIQPNGVCEQYGPQSLSIFCPPYEYEYANTQEDYTKQNTYQLCKAWLQNGGPRYVGPVMDNGVYSSAAWPAAASNGALGLQHLRNYAFTMMGYAKFKYRASNQVPTPEVFEFAGDDDMWIFVDGVLAVDLGGTHLSAPGSVNILTLAQNNHGCHAGEPLSQYTNCTGASDATGWADNTWHHLHFFYADRQTDGSNIYIRTSLSELAPSRYGQPAVGGVLAKLDSAGNQTVTMVMNTTLDQATLEAIQSLGQTQPAIVVMRSVTDPATGAKKMEVYGYYVNSVSEGANQGASGVQYNFTGELRDASGQVLSNSIVVGGDLVAFNFPTDQQFLASDEFQQQKAQYIAWLTSQGYTDAEATWNQLIAWNTQLSFKITSSSGKSVVGYPDDPGEWPVADFKAPTQGSPFVLDSAITRPDFSEKANVLTQIAENNDGELPLDMTADLLFTSVPGGVGKNGNPLALTNEEKLIFSQTGFGGETAANTKVYGVNEATGAAMCFSNGVESCFSISYPVMGPFRINVRVFDHLGHFVSQYQKSMNEEELHAALGGINTAESACSEKGVEYPLYGQTGAGFMTIKMYPVSQSGRMVATGPYIYQVTYVQEFYKSCIKEGSSAWMHTMYYTRTNETYRRGYKRAKTN